MQQYFTDIFLLMSGSQANTSAWFKHDVHSTGSCAGSYHGMVEWVRDGFTGRCCVLGILILESIKTTNELTCKVQNHYMLKGPSHSCTFCM